MVGKVSSRFGVVHFKAIAIFKNLPVISTFSCLGAQERFGGGGGVDPVLGLDRKQLWDPATLVPSA